MDIVIEYPLLQNHMYVTIYLLNLLFASVTTLPTPLDQLNQILPGRISLNKRTDSSACDYRLFL